MGRNANKDDGKMEMLMRCWTGNGNGMIPQKWEGMGTTIVISLRPLVKKTSTLNRTTIMKTTAGRRTLMTAARSLQ